MHELKQAIAWAKEAGQLYLQQRAHLVRLTDKADGETVTTLDKDLNALILHRIEEAFPQDSILSEEDDPVNHQGDRLWIVDPIDGTVNMAHQIPFSCISIALWEGDEPLVGVVYDPVHQELFAAAHGMGATLNGDPIHVSTTTLEEGLVLHGQPYNKQDASRGWEQIAGIREASLFDRQLGSAALMLCYVAAGRGELLAIPGTKPWDDAAGALIVQEAGGVVTDFEGRVWTPRADKILAGNPEAHAQARLLL